MGSVIVSTVLAAIDNSAAAPPVLAMAEALASILAGSVETLHIAGDDAETVRAIAKRAADDDVLGVVVAGRRMRGGKLNHLAHQVAEGVGKTVLVVPPEATSRTPWQRVLIAMKGTPTSVRHLEEAVAVAAAARLELVVVHVDDEGSIPSFSDQVAHETSAYADEFEARYLNGAANARLELRVGEPVEEILGVAKAVRADVVVLGRPQAVAAARRSTVTKVLDRSHIPVLLVTQAES
jgi:nucleotide-binding universal stress UspA family protein